MSAVLQIGRGYFALDTEGITSIDQDIRTAVRSAFAAAKSEPSNIKLTEMATSQPPFSEIVVLQTTNRR